MASSHPAQNAEPRFTNRLAQERSPYLLQHAHNPVDWRPWNTDALEAARQEDRPIFLSVGYSACHWCHVMERESFENEAVAALLNRDFICIKVDREERPDVDEIYMTAVQMMQGQGGWPMSVFLTPDGRPFYGGTYFPPQSRGGRIGFSSLVTQLADAWHHRRREIETIADEIADNLRQASNQKPIAAPTTQALDAESLLRSAVTDLAERFDAQSGGFGGAPKFPPHHALRLLTQASRVGNDDAPPLLLTTLDKMALGGIYDHIGGGFHRYATDAVWLLPHFEKMLYDNALLARVYADAYDMTGREAYARIARETCDWVLRDLIDPVGGFHAALDADSEGEEGKYYVWTQEEINEVLGKEAGSAFGTYYRFQAGGNFHDEATGRATGANISYLAIGNSEVVLPDALDTQTSEQRAALLARRYERVPPGKDDKVITSWNGLMIGALAHTGQILSEPRFLAAARRAADCALTTLRPEGKLARRYAKGEAGLPAFLDDYVYLADGLLDLFDATGEILWADEARGLADTVLSRFWDTTGAGFFFTADDHETLIVRSKDLFDRALPSANGVAARVLVRLGERSDGEPYKEKARAIFRAYHGLLSRAPQGTATLISALHDLEKSPESALLTGPMSLVANQDTLTLGPGEIASAHFTLRIAPGYHVNANVPQAENVIPTTATLSTNAPASMGPVSFPTAAKWHSGDETLSIYEGDATFTVPITLAPNATPGSYQLVLTLHCQPCSESECLSPVEMSAAIHITVRL